MAAFYRDPDVIRFMGAPEFSEEEVAEAIRGHAERYYERRQMGALAGVLKGTDEIVGRYSLQIVELDGTEEVEVTYLTASKYRRRGLAREAVQALLSAGRRKGMVRIVALIQPDNLPSETLARALGFRFERDTRRDGYAMKLYALEQGGSASAADPLARLPRTGA